MPDFLHELILGGFKGDRDCFRAGGSVSLWESLGIEAHRFPDGVHLHASQREHRECGGPSIPSTPPSGVLPFIRQKPRPRVYKFRRSPTPDVSQQRELERVRASEEVYEMRVQALASLKQRSAETSTRDSLESDESSDEEAVQNESFFDSKPAAAQQTKTDVREALLKVATNTRNPKNRQLMKRLLEESELGKCSWRVHQFLELCLAVPDSFYVAEPRLQKDEILTSTVKRVCADSSSDSSGDTDSEISSSDSDTNSDSDSSSSDDNEDLRQHVKPMRHLATGFGCEAPLRAATHVFLNDESWGRLLRKTLEVLHVLSQVDMYNFFAEPVTDEVLPDYSERIKVPCDFSSIRSRAQRNEYASVLDVVADIDLVFACAFKINADSPLVWPYMLAVLTVWMHLRESWLRLLRLTVEQVYDLHRQALAVRMKALETSRMDESLAEALSDSVNNSQADANDSLADDGLNDSLADIDDDVVLVRPAVVEETHSVTDSATDSANSDTNNVKDSVSDSVTNNVVLADSTPVTKGETMSDSTDLVAVSDSDEYEGSVADSVVAETRDVGNGATDANTLDELANSTPVVESEPSIENFNEVIESETTERKDTSIDVGGGVVDGKDSDNDKDKDSDSDKDKDSESDSDSVPLIDIFTMDSPQMDPASALERSSNEWRRIGVPKKPLPPALSTFTFQQKDVGKFLCSFDEIDDNENEDAKNVSVDGEVDEKKESRPVFSSLPPMPTMPSMPSMRPMPQMPPMPPMPPMLKLHPHNFEPKVEKASALALKQRAIATIRVLQSLLQCLFALSRRSEQVQEKNGELCDAFAECDVRSQSLPRNSQSPFCRVRHFSPLRNENEKQKKRGGNTKKSEGNTKKSEGNRLKKTEENKPKIIEGNEKTIEGNEKSEKSWLKGDHNINNSACQNDLQCPERQLPDAPTTEDAIATITKVKTLLAANAVAVAAVATAAANGAATIAVTNVVITPAVDTTEGRNPRALGRRVDPSQL
ncbi:MAG: hypothetical protein MHM6MM_003796 [Cercozoa sp. M6MM]